MRTSLKSRIDSVCNAQTSTKTLRFENEVEWGLHRTTMLDRFITLRRDVIRSVMGEFVTYFSDQFYNCRIINDDDHFDQFGKRAFRAGVTFRLYKDADIGDKLQFVPHYSVLWDDVNSIVRFYRSNTTKSLAGEAGFDGKCDLHELTADLIESKLLLFTSWLFEERPAN